MRTREKPTTRNLATRSQLTRNLLTRNLATTAALVALAALLAFFVPHAAFAAAEDDENVVSTSQLPDSSFIYDTNISDLSSADLYYDNQAVQVVGEAIGDKIFDTITRDNCWIVVGQQGAKTNDTISVFMLKNDAEKIDSFGRHNVKGTTLRVRGTFHLVCSEHAGQSDLHADYVSVVEKGEHTADAFSWELFVPGAIAVAVGLVFVGAYFWIREKRR